tara:strand:+ start:3996 stop:4175 length:180 start_codon:yes stop_codon:yes gene_type:complete
MIIKILRDIKPLLSDGRHKFKEGDEAELPKVDARRLIALGAAKELKEVKAKVIEPEAKE